MGMLNFSGVTEAFVHSVATHAELRTLNIRLVGFAILYIALAVFFVHIPGVETVGLIWANCINMLLRIAVGYVFINKYFKVLFVCYHSQLTLQRQMEWTLDFLWHHFYQSRLC